MVVSSLLTHHMENHEVVEFLEWMETKARMGWFINDLHRQAVPYWLFRAMTRLTRWHRFVKARWAGLDSAELSGGGLAGALRRGWAGGDEPIS